MTATAGSTLEIILNGELAALLRCHGLEAEAEQSLRSDGRRHQVDVLVELGEHAVAIEAEFAPGRTIRSDAETRLPSTPLVWRGLAVEFVFALVYPESLKSLPESRARTELGGCESLQFAIVSRGDSATAAADDHILGIWQAGSVATLADCLLDFWIRGSAGGSVEETVALASASIERASEILRRAPAPHPMAAVDSDPEATSALIWLNALLFQELLVQNLDLTRLAPPHRETGIPKPDIQGRPGVLLEQWNAILEINWWPIFHVAREALAATPSRPAALALQGLVRTAIDIAGKGVITRHDIAGRIFHRLLETRKFLATNYTTIPAAVMLAGLALDREHALWQGMDWASDEHLKKLRIVDPACGSGTLLMAVLQETLKQRRRAGGVAETRADAVNALLEHAIHGYDVVPAAVHLTAATLAMAEMRQVIANMPLYWMPHDVRDGKARMGSLDFLREAPSQGVAQFLPLFIEEGRDPSRVTGRGERAYDAYMPRGCDLVIANPPYTRAGGPGTAENSDWNPIFGSALSSADAETMKAALRRTLNRTPASLYAGLGSAFAVLACDRVKPGGRVALVLPATALTGSRWKPVRAMLLERFDVDWVVVSHDGRNRPAKAGLPGRRWVAFSESTRIAEALIVATRRPREGSVPAKLTRFVNLRRNPDEPIDAMAVTRSLLARAPDVSGNPVEIAFGDVVWGEVLPIEQSRLDEGPWFYATFCQGRLLRTAVGLAERGIWRAGGQAVRVPIAMLSEVCELGPYHMQIKNPTQGLFEIVQSDDPARAGHPAIWHHSHEAMTTLESASNARLRERLGRDPAAQSAMLARAGRLHLACELGHAPQRLAAVVTDEAMLGVRSWITLRPCAPAPGKEEALCLWLNTTLGLMLRVLHSNRPYLGRSCVPHEVARNLPVLDVDALKAAQREAALRLFRACKSKTLQGFSRIAEDPVRRELDRRFFKEVLGYEVGEQIDSLAKALNREPTITTRH